MASELGEKKFPARTIWCLFVSVIVFTMLISYAGMTRASRGRAFDRENGETVYNIKNMTRIMRHVQYDRASPGYRHSRQPVIYPSLNVLLLCCNAAEIVKFVTVFICCLSLSDFHAAVRKTCTCTSNKPILFGNPDEECMTTLFL